MIGTYLAHLIGARFAMERLVAIPHLSERGEGDHINNVEIAWMLDHQRMALAREFGWWEYQSEGRTGMLASVTVEFVSEMWAGRPAVVASAVETIGRSSYAIVQTMKQGGQVAALARSVLVLVGRQGAEAWPADIRARMERAALRRA